MAVASPSMPFRRRGNERMSFSGILTLTRSHAGPGGGCQASPMMTGTRPARIASKMRTLDAPMPLGHRTNALSERTRR